MVRAIGSVRRNPLIFAAAWAVLLQATCLSAFARAEVPCLAVLKGHHGSVNHVVFSRDGRLVFTGGFDNTVRCWDAATGKQLWSQKSPAAVGKLVCLAKDDFVAVGLANGEVLFFSYGGDKKGDLVHGKDAITALAASPDGRGFAVGDSRGTISMWDLGKGKLIKSIPIKESAIDLPSPVFGLAFSPGADHLAALVWAIVDVPLRDQPIPKGGIEGRTLQMFNAFTGELLHQQADLQNHLDMLSVAPRGTKVLVSGGVVLEFEFINNRWRANDMDNTSAHGYYAHGSDKLRVFTSSQMSVREANGTRPAHGVFLRVMGTSKNAPVGFMFGGREAHSQPILAASVSPDGTRLATASKDALVAIWHLTPPVDRFADQLAEGLIQKTAADPLGCVAFLGALRPKALAKPLQALTPLTKDADPDMRRVAQEAMDLIRATNDIVPPIPASVTSTAKMLTLRALERPTGATPQKSDALQAQIGNVLKAIANLEQIASELDREALQAASDKPPRLTSAAMFRANAQATRADIARLRQELASLQAAMKAAPENK